MRNKPKLTKKEKRNAGKKTIIIGVKHIQITCKNGELGIPTKLSTTKAKKTN